jgi:DNA-binding FadR family transcriptional regulator
VSRLPAEAERVRVTDGVRFRPVQPVRAYERIVEQVEEALFRGELLPGARLPSERELMSQFSVSRSTVREALRVLESNGVVRSRPGDPNGPEVLAFSAGSLRKQLVRLTRVDQLSLAELIAFRMILDGSANQLAARLRTPEQLAEMEAALADMRAALDEGYERFSEADVAFHDAVARASRNGLIEVCSDVVRGVVLGLIADKIERADNRRALMEESLGHHAEVLGAVRAGDGVEAARLARANLYDYYAGYVPESDRASLRALVDPAT